MAPIRRDAVPSNSQARSSPEVSHRYPSASMGPTDHDAPSHSQIRSSPKREDRDGYYKDETYSTVKHPFLGLKADDRDVFYQV